MLFAQATVTRDILWQQGHQTDSEPVVLELDLVSNVARHAAEASGKIKVIRMG